jgi:ArsR family transcriptional regulator
MKFDEESQRVFEQQANILRVLANPKRLMIMQVLSEGMKTVTEIANTLDLSLQNTSQHLRLMKDQGIVRARREGQSISYQQTNATFSECCAMARKALAEEMYKKGKDMAKVEAMYTPT